MALKKTILLADFLVLLLGLLVIVPSPDEHQSNMIASSIIHENPSSSQTLMNPAEDLFRHGAFSPPNCPSSPRTGQVIRTWLGAPAFKSNEASFEIAQARFNSPPPQKKIT